MTDANTKTGEPTCPISRQGREKKLVRSAATLALFTALAQLWPATNAAAIASAPFAGLESGKK
jgi:hypothetical protein